MGQYLAWDIPRRGTFKFVQIKSMESQMAMPKGDINLYGFI